MTLETGDTQVARTILDQMGGALFVRMTGAKQLTAYPKALSFRLPGGGGFTKKGINYVTVELTDKDTYNVDFIRLRCRCEGSDQHRWQIG